VNAAIVGVAIKTLLTYRDLPMRITGLNGRSETYPVTNLGIIKNPHFAGEFRYDTPVAPDDGRLLANLSYDHSLKSRLQVLCHLLKGRFLGLPNTLSREVKNLKISSSGAFSVEMDGELVLVRSASFSIIPKAIRCCQ
jgi:diacylglycerol kinase family enzyme